MYNEIPTQYLMPAMQNMYQFILEMNKLKLVLRNTLTSTDKKESTAEHSWSVSMIVLVLMEQLKKEFIRVDELKSIKLALIHDIVEIYAGDALVFDLEARKEKKILEAEALKKLMDLNPDFALQLHSLWHEFEEKESLEAKIANAADAICPIFQRLQSKQSYVPFNISLGRLEQIKTPLFEFSSTFTALFEKLKTDLLNEHLIEAL